jgi:hypothetical protein
MQKLLSVCSATRPSALKLMNKLWFEKDLCLLKIKFQAKNAIKIAFTKGKEQRKVVQDKEKEELTQKEIKRKVDKMKQIIENGGLE